MLFSSFLFLLLTFLSIFTSFLSYFSSSSSLSLLFTYSLSLFLALSFHRPFFPSLSSLPSPHSRLLFFHPIKSTSLTLSCPFFNFFLFFSNFPINLFNRLSLFPLSLLFLLLHNLPCHQISLPILASYAYLPPPFTFLSVSLTYPFFTFLFPTFPFASLSLQLNLNHISLPFFPFSIYFIYHWDVLLPFFLFSPPSFLLSLLFYFVFLLSFSLLLLLPSILPLLFHFPPLLVPLN